MVIIIITRSCGRLVQGLKGRWNESQSWWNDSQSWWNESHSWWNESQSWWNKSDLVERISELVERISELVERISVLVERISRVGGTYLRVGGTHRAAAVELPERNVRLCAIELGPNAVHWSLVTSQCRIQHYCPHSLFTAIIVTT